MFEMHATRCDVFLGKVRTQLYFSFSERPKISPREPAPGGATSTSSVAWAWDPSSRLQLSTPGPCLACLACLLYHESLSGWVVWRPSRLMFAFSITCRPLWSCLLDATKVLSPIGGACSETKSLTPSRLPRTCAEYLGLEGQKAKSSHLFQIKTH